MTQAQRKRMAIVAITALTCPAFRTQVRLLADTIPNGNVAALDLLTFDNCLAGPNTQAAVECQSSDLDSDGDVDLQDFYRLQRGIGELSGAPRITGVQPGPGAWLVGADGLRSLVISFDRSVTIPPGAVSLRALKSGSLSNFTIQYNDGTHTIGIALDPPIRDDVLTLVLDFTIVDRAGTPLDGEVRDPSTAAFPTGDGHPGGQAVFRFNILQGDVNRDGTVNSADAVIIQAALGRCLGDPQFNLAADLNGDGCVNVVDVDIFRSGENQSLPQTDHQSPSVSRIVPNPSFALPNDFHEITLSFSEPVAPTSVVSRSTFLLDESDHLLVPNSVDVAPDKLSARFTFAKPISNCGAYSLNVSNAIADLSGALLAPPPQNPILSGLVLPAPPILNSHLTITKNPSVVITGSAPSGLSIEVAGAFGLLPQVPVQGGTFSVEVPLSPNQVNHVYFTAISACRGLRSPTAVDAIIQDNAPPSLFIDFPSDGAEISTQTTDVTGRVGDMLTGFVCPNQDSCLNVTVNGQRAVVDIGIGNNGTFVAPGVPLTDGASTPIVATAMDYVGNTVTRSITVKRTTIPPDVPQMIVVSGNGQTAPVNTQLHDPIVVRMTRGATGPPITNKVVTFSVTRSSGRLTAAPGQDCVNVGDLMLQCRTNSSGEVAAMWRMGGDAGCGNDRVEATSKDIAGTVAFCASAMAGVPGQINIGSGNNQRAEVNAPAPEPLVAWVSDSCNGGKATPVTFRVIGGGGKVNGADFVTVTTDPTGHAGVNFTLGPDPVPNTITADFSGNRSEPATFTVYGFKRDETRPTRFTGLVLDNASHPLHGAAVLLMINGASVGETTTNYYGNFAIAVRGESHLTSMV